MCQCLPLDLHSPKQQLLPTGDYWALDIWPIQIKMCWLCKIYTRRHQQDGWIRCPSSYRPLNNGNLASTHRQKCLCENCGSQHHRVTEPERVLPTMCLVILVPAVDYAVVCELIPDTLSCGPRVPGEQWLRQSPTDKRAFVEIQSSQKVPAQGYS